LPPSDAPAAEEASSGGLPSTIAEIVGGFLFFMFLYLAFRLKKVKKARQAASLSQQAANAPVQAAQNGEIPIKEASANAAAPAQPTK
jgi:hypothetical protein